MADHDARPVTLRRTGHDDGARFHRPDLRFRGPPIPIPFQRSVHAVRPLGAEPVDEASIDRPVEGPDVGRGNGPFGDGAASDGATPLFLEPPALEFGDEAGESRLVALELGEPPLRLLLPNPVALEARCCSASRTEMSELAQLVRPEPLQLARLAVSSFSRATRLASSRAISSIRRRS